TVPARYYSGQWTCRAKLYGGTGSLPMTGSQSRSPASAKDSKLNCSEFNSTHSHRVPSGHHCMLCVLALKGWVGDLRNASRF
uniref:Uncharacterized protein n=1 Tax=Gadus morhua TaxID=8049 RepID=A0A8C5CKX1_GADMO